MVGAAWLEKLAGADTFDGKTALRTTCDWTGDIGLENEKKRIVDIVMEGSIISFYTGSVSDLKLGGRGKGAR